jgi:hypothetical protein
VSRARPVGLQLSGEIGLVTAVLAQVVAELTSDKAHLREEAWTFVNDAVAVAFWTSLVNVDPQAFVEQAHRFQTATGPG